MIAVLVISAACTSPQDEKVSTTSPEVSDLLEGSAYNEELANKAGADEYGMKMYVMAFLKRGPNRDLPSEEADKLQRAHMDNISRMAEEGKLVLAGPFGDDGDIRGIYIFDVPTIEEAQALTESDPAIQAGSLVMELHPWYGAAGLVFMGDLHKKLSKKDI